MSGDLSMRPKAGNRMEGSKKEVERLVSNFKKQEREFTKGSYNETEVRGDFIDPFFKALGWDVRNEKVLPQHLREVVHEDSLEVESTNKKPDYAFRLGSERKFFVEAKKPFVKIETKKDAAFQARRYGWSANHPISILTNFKYLIIFDTRVLPKESDPPNRCRLCIYHYSDYLPKFDEIYQLISREAIYSGNFEKTFPFNRKIRGQIDIDEYFFEQINQWRLLLAKELIEQDPSMDSVTLNDIIQKLINRIIFLRFCEDRNLEEYEKLLETANKSNIQEIYKLFKEADEKYDSGLFDVTKDIIGVSLDLGNETVLKIVKDLYYPNSPYAFSVIDSGILGDIYELFLSKKIVYEDGRVFLKEKGKRNRDVVTTPKRIIQEIIEETASKEINGLSPDKILSLKILDCCCGSGAFLSEMYQSIVDYLRELYVKQGDTTKVYKGKNNSWFLTYEEKERILLNCIYGVDIDFNASEVTKFSLLIKLLEDETKDSLRNKRKILPFLEDNIKCGNSLIDDRIYEKYDPSKLKDSEIERINAFNWGDEFKLNSKNKFDIIIGNPPYTKTEDMKKNIPLEYEFFKGFYKDSAFKQFDMYYLFIDRAISLLKDDGKLGFIVPHKFMKIASGRTIRSYIAEKGYLAKIVSFNAIQIFKKRSTYTCLLFLDKKQNDAFEYISVNDYLAWLAKNPNSFSQTTLKQDVLKDDNWVLLTEIEQKLYDKLHSVSFKLEREAIPFNGIQTSKNSVYMVEGWKEHKDTISFKKKGKEYEVEKAILKPYWTNKRGEIFSSFDTLIPNTYLIFPYKIVNEKPVLYSISEMKKKFPLTLDYLNDFKSELDSRDIRPLPATDDEWYRYGRHQSLTIFENRPKIIVGNLFFEERYVYDTKNIYFSSGGTAGCVGIYMKENSEYSPYYLLGLLNSRPIEWVASIIGDVFQGYCYAHGTDELKKLPIREIKFDDKRDVSRYNEVCKLVKTLIAIKKKFNGTQSTRRKEILHRLLMTTRKKLEDLIVDLYGIKNLVHVIPK